MYGDEIGAGEHDRKYFLFKSISYFDTIDAISNIELILAVLNGPSNSIFSAKNWSILYISSIFRISPISRVCSRVAITESGNFIDFGWLSSLDGYNFQCISILSPYIFQTHLIPKLSWF